MVALFCGSNHCFIVKLKSLIISASILLSSQASAGTCLDLICSDTIAIPNQEFFLRPTIPQRFLDEAEGKVIVRLTDEDYTEAAEKLGVDIAAIKAVIDIETGRTHCGFIAPRTPVIDFDTKIFKTFCRKRGLNPSTLPHSNKPHTGTRQEREHQLLAIACAVDSTTALEATMWGMFQIGGFNWKRCGAKSLDDFVYKMRYSERTQLELFTNFLVNTDLVRYLKSKNWRAFAYRYNGPKYAIHGYHTRLARAYKKHSR